MNIYNRIPRGLGPHKAVGFVAVLLQLLPLLRLLPLSVVVVVVFLASVVLDVLLSSLLWLIGEESKSHTGFRESRLVPGASWTRGSEN